MNEYERFKNEIYFIKYYYTNLINYYNFEELKQNCFNIFKNIYDSISLSSEEKDLLQNKLFNTYNNIIWIWNFDDISKGEF